MAQSYGVVGVATKILYRRVGNGMSDCFGGFVDVCLAVVEIFQRRNLGFETDFVYYIFGLAAQLRFKPLMRDRRYIFWM
jgi:hypothetical protein